MEIRGKYNTARVFTDNIEESAIGQIITLCSQEFTLGSTIRIMPDVHSGAGCTIGTTMTLKNRAVPNLVGVDIGCGMEVIQIANKYIELSKLDKTIYEQIPSGFNIRDKEHKFNGMIDLDELKCRKEVDLNRARKSIGTLGGGNHFIEADRDEEGNIYVVVHSGSRHLGQEVALLYQNEAFRELNKNTKADIDILIAELKAQGKKKDIQKEIKKVKNQVATDIPKALAYAEGKLFDDYIHDMRIVQQFARINRKAMVEQIVKSLKLDVVNQFTTTHNYIETDAGELPDGNNMILRKGAVSAKEGELLIIPINMRDGSIICRGKGNQDWNWSAPHGAGRLMSRSAAKNTFTLTQFKESMEGIYTTSVSRETLDECPQAYKPIEDIISNIEDTVDIINIIKPVYNFKASE